MNIARTFIISAAGLAALNWPITQLHSDEREPADAAPPSAVDNHTDQETEHASGPDAAPPVRIELPPSGDGPDNNGPRFFDLPPNVQLPFVPGVEFRRGDGGTAEDPDDSTIIDPRLNKDDPASPKQQPAEKDEAKDATTGDTAGDTPRNGERRPAPPPLSHPAISKERYRVIVDRNIFSRTRGRAAPTRSTREPGSGERPPAATPAPPTDPAAQMVLIGISVVGDHATALFEDRRNNTTVTARVGDTVAERSVTAIRLDGVESAAAGPDTAALFVTVGQTLAGGYPATPAAGAPTGNGGTKPATTSSTPTAAADESATAPAAKPASESSAQDVLERLRQRRQQELQR